MFPILFESFWFIHFQAYLPNKLRVNLPTLLLSGVVMGLVLDYCAPGSLRTSH